MKINLSEIKIEKMQESHIENIASLEKECFSEPWSDEALKAELKNNNAHFFVAQDKEKILGYIGSQCYFGECYISNIAVFRKFQNQKIGSML